MLEDNTGKRLINFDQNVVIGHYGYISEPERGRDIE